MEKILKKMTFEQKLEFLTGMGTETDLHKELGIPEIRFTDGPAGVRTVIDAIDGEGCTCIPSSAALGASWSVDVVEKCARVIANDCKKLGFDILLAPGINMKRTPRCGRNFEYFSEDPILSGILGAAYINGLENEGVGTSLKHFAANNQERDRLYINADIDERTLREIYLRAFEVALENSKPSTVMCAYNMLNGVYCFENKYLLNDILKEEWGYDGTVISDWGAVHNSANAIAGGLDIRMPYNACGAEELREGVERGIVSTEDIDRAVMSKLKFVFSLAKKRQKLQSYSRDLQHELVQEAAGECITLLKNDDDVLPIKPEKYKKILVVGRLAEKPVIFGSGSGKVWVNDERIDKPLDYIKKYGEENGIQVDYQEIYNDKYIGAENVKFLNKLMPGDYDAIIVFIGNNYGSDCETEYWDRDVLNFQNYMNGMVNSSADSCENVIAVMQTGSATIPTYWHKRIKGIIQMWYAGEGGGKAIADILFGKVNPSGKLSETFITKERDDMDVIGDGYKTWYSEGMFVGYRHYDNDNRDVWFPFGHGLSYTKFEYSDIKINEDEVTFKVKNAGDTEGKEVVQLYVHQVNSTVIRPYKELKFFDKVNLKPGEEKTVVYKLKERDFQYYSTALHKWYAESGIYEILVGASSSDIRLKASFEYHNTDNYCGRNRKSQFIMA